MSPKSTPEISTSRLYPDWAAPGHTIDYRLRLSFGGDLGPGVRQGVAIVSDGAPLRGAPSRRGRHALVVAGQRLLAAVDAHLAGPALTDAALTRLCYVASFYEDVYRTGQIRQYSMLADRRLARALPPRAKICGPTFAGSEDVPADADFSRQGGLITWRTEDFLRRLGATAPLPQLRAKLRDHLRKELIAARGRSARSR